MICETLKVVVKNYGDVVVVIMLYSVVLQS
jgi:hypothetical protein